MPAFPGMPGLFDTPGPLDPSLGLLAAPVPLWFQANFARQQQKPDENRIFAAFGRFIAAYALAEGGLHIAVRFFSGMPEPKARIVFAGMRLSDVIERLRSFVKDTPNADTINLIIEHINLIGGARDQFVHRLIEYDHGKGLKITNGLICKSVENTDPRTFTLPELEAMELDCRVIFVRLAIICEHPEPTTTDVSFVELYAPWRYKPAVPDNHKKKPREVPKESRRQRRASRTSPPAQK
jgi:hypothetical protein